MKNKTHKSLETSLGAVMTTEQESHLARIKSNFVTKVDAKYRAGQKEHGGELRYKGVIDLIDKAINEAVDQVVYLETLRETIVR